MGYQSFEELEVYKSAREFRKKIYKLIKGLPLDEKYNLGDQMRRAALSLTNNIAEGHGRYHFQENIQFCRISRGSLMELIDDLNTCIDEKYFEQNYLNHLKGEGYRINKMLNGYSGYLKKRKSGETNQLNQLNQPINFINESTKSILKEIAMKRILPLIVCLLISFTLAAGQLMAADKKTDDTKQTWSAKASSQDYKIGAGDILEIVTWKEPDFSREEILVRLDGKLTFPLLNDVQAAGQTTLELKRVIEQGLKTYVSNPVVTVNVREPLSKQFYILGEVLNTGQYPLAKHLTVLQAFALAGGFTEWASKKEIILLRHEGGQDKIYRINYKSIVKGNDLSQNLKLKADDTIIVP